MEENVGTASRMALSALGTKADQYQLAFQGKNASCRIEASREVLESIRFQVSRASNGIGGLCMAGVLLGIRAGAAIRILDWRPIACGHTRGPSFVLSERELAGLASYLEGSQSMAAAHGWSILGWFVSHSTPEFALHPEERDIQQRFFAYDGCLLVIHADGGGEARCAVHLGTELLPDPPFVVKPVRLSPSERQPPPALAAPVGQGVPFHQTPVAWSAFAALLLAAVSIGIWATVQRRQPSVVSPPAPPPIEILSLHAGPRDGRFVIAWNGQSETIRYASSYNLFIRDGDRQENYELSRSSAVSGVHYYRPKGRVIEVKLRLSAGDGRSFEESTQYRDASLPRTLAVPLTAGVIEPPQPDRVRKPAKKKTPRRKSTTSRSS
jgi:hypothetical protein